MIVYKDFEFEMGHRLDQHGGLCKNIHGHSYKIFVYFTGQLNKQGLLIDFGRLNDYMEEIIEDYDHRDLNQYTEFMDSPTAERMAHVIFERIKEKDDRISKVRVYETEKCYAEYYE
jgi:6-pyruvoyltetrahydropterin/6-carboxytetrahydropterin synthase